MKSETQELYHLLKDIYKGFKKSYEETKDPVTLEYINGMTDTIEYLDKTIGIEKNIKKKAKIMRDYIILTTPFFIVTFFFLLLCRYADKLMGVI